MRTASTLLLLGMLTAASPAPPTDLSELLASPQTGGFVDLAQRPGVIIGAFDAGAYALYLSGDPGSAAGVQSTLEGEGFSRGYGRAWEQHHPVLGQSGIDPNVYLAEVVEEYATDEGANQRYVSAQRATATETGLYKSFDPGLPSSFGAVIDANTTMLQDFLVVFQKGNDVYVIRVSGGGADQTNLAVTQSTAQFKMAPAFTTAPTRVGGQTPNQAANQAAGQAPGRAPFPSDAIAGPAAVLALLLGVGVPLYAARSGRRREPAAVPPEA